MLPKGDKARHYIKNWRPITLLTTVYKIASGCIAARFKKYLHKLINPGQTGFMSNRYIGENTRLIYDIMQYTEDEEILGLLLLIDFEKAFDTLSWNFIQQTLDFFLTLVPLLDSGLRFFIQTKHLRLIKVAISLKFLIFRGGVDKQIHYPLIYS